MKAEQLSKTASFIAIKFYGLTRIPSFQSLFDESVINYYDHVVQSLPPPLNYYHYWLKFNWVRQLYIWSEELFLPGDLLHIIARKFYIRQFVNELKDEGYEQLIVLGAGFDDLAFTFSQKGVSCFELEVPYMANLKQQFFNKYYPDHKHPNIISSHLTKDQQQLPFLVESKINKNKKTILIAEGFFDYLPINLVETILNKVRRFFQDSPTLISTHFALNELPTHHRWSFQTGVKAVGEQLKLHQDIKEFRKLLAKHEYIVKKQFNYESMTSKLQQKIDTDLPMLPGFYLLMCK